MFEELNDDEWVRIASLAVDEPVHPHRRGRPRAETRVVANAVLWILTTGERWSKLPARYPSGTTCRRRFDEWLADGTLIEMVNILSESGRLFAYVPQPQSAEPPASRRASTLASTSGAQRLRGVFWANPESWRDADSFSCRAGDLPVASSPPLQTAYEARKSIRKVEHEAPAPNAATAQKRIDDYCGYAIHAMAQQVTRQMNLAYRASAEIIKDGRRIERSGLIGPRFPDLESAECHAFKWARDWIDRQANPAAAPVPSTGAEVALDGKEAVVRPLSAMLAELPSPDARKLVPAAACGASDWLHRTDGRGDAKPPELVYRA